MKDMMHDMELAEQFLSGKMTEQERTSLANRLDQDKEFNTLLQDMDQMMEGIRSSGRKTTVEEKLLRLKGLAQKEEKKKKSIVLPRVESHFQVNYVRYAIAASVVLFAAFIFVISNPFGIVQQDLYAAYFEPFDSPGSGLTRGGENGISVKASAYEAYDEENYVEAASLFEKSLLEKDEAITRLCLANAYMSLNDFEKAEATLIRLLKEPDLVTQTKWYLALTYVKQNKLERARATLWEISDSSTYGEKAKRLLEDLD